MASIQLFIQINNTWMPTLTIPVADCNRFSLKPLKWLRFLGYTIYGRDGYISARIGGRAVNYQSAVRGGSSYYFNSADEPRFLDTQCIADRTSDSGSTETCLDFGRDIRLRDGTCIVTDEPAHLCVAAHYYPHSKGSEFLSRVMQRRDGPSNLNNINDTRNALLLYGAIHQVFGVGEVAFLKTPNFALSDSDIPPSPGSICGPQTNASGRFILQHFKEQSSGVATMYYPHNQDARQPANTDDFPPPAVLDMWYGCAAVLRWGVAGTINEVRSSAGPYYYDIPSSEENSPGDDDLNGGNNLDRESLTPPKGKGKERAQSSRARGKEKEGRTQSGSHLNTMGEAMEILMLLWAHPRSGHRGDPSSTQEENDQSRDKVNTWLQAQ